LHAELPLRPGASGPLVAELQERLERLGFTSDADGRGLYGEVTTAVVRAFQGQRGLRVDGICGRDTW